jgi:hypothetical protein
MINIKPAAEYMSEMAVWKAKNERKIDLSQSSYQNGYNLAIVAMDTT